MASRLPNEDEDEANVAAAFQSALAQQVAPLLGSWDPVAAMATMQRNFMHHQQQQQQQLQNGAPTNGQSASQAAAAAMAAAAASSLTQPQNTLSNLPPLWTYNLQAAAAAAAGAQAGANVPPATPVSSAAVAALASSLGPATSYLNHLPNLHTPESLLSFQQNLILLEQLQQQRQLLAANPHLLMAAAAAQSTSNQNSSTNLQSQHQHQLQLQQQNLLTVAMQHQLSALSNGANLIQQTSNANGSNGSPSLLTTVSSGLNSSMTNQHQDSLVDQHFRRSLGEDYNQIIAGKVDKINVGK